MRRSAFPHVPSPQLGAAGLSKTGAASSAESFESPSTASAASAAASRAAAATRRALSAFFFASLAEAVAARFAFMRAPDAAVFAARLATALSLPFAARPRSSARAPSSSRAAGGAAAAAAASGAACASSPPPSLAELSPSAAPAPLSSNGAMLTYELRRPDETARAAGARAEAAQVVARRGQTHVDGAVAVRGGDDGAVRDVHVSRPRPPAAARGQLDDVARHDVRRVHAVAAQLCRRIRVMSFRNE